MKYYLFKKESGMALYKEKESKVSRYLDYFPVPISDGIELRLFSKDEAEQEIKILDNHFGEYGWEIKEYENNKKEEKNI